MQTAIYAGAGRRLVAALLDSAISYAVIMLLLMVLVGGTVALVPNSGTATSTSSGIFVLIVYIVLPVVYWIIIPAKMHGQTLGKKVIGIRVVNMSGQTPSMLVFFLRELIGKTVSAIILMIGYLMILWDGKKQGLHDKIAGTVVVKV